MRARHDARGVGRSGRGRRASRENVQAREPTAGVSCERAAPRASRGVSRADPRDAASSDKSARDTCATRATRSISGAARVETRFFGSGHPVAKTG